MDSERKPVERIVFVHPAALCESRHVGEGTRIWPFAHVQDGAAIGRNCNIGEHAYVERGARVGDRVTVKNQVMIWEGVTIEDDVFVGPGAIFTNDLYPRSRRLREATDRYRRRDDWLVPTTVRSGASIGAGAIILPGVTVGRYACVGAGAVVIRSVADYRIVVGNPARDVGWVCACGVPLRGEGAGIAGVASGRNPQAEGADVNPSAGPSDGGASSAPGPDMRSTLSCPRCERRFRWRDGALVTAD